MVKYIFLLCCISSVNINAEEVLIDPTKPLDYKVSRVQKAGRPALPKLNSIFISDDKPTVILNNKLYSRDHWVNGYQIVKIDDDSVLLRYAEKLYRLNLYNNKERFIK